MASPLFSRQLEAFFAVGRHLHFGKAADEVCLSQSALSHRIITLEEALQTKLFLRLPEGVKLTPAGQKLMRFCLMADSAEQELLRSMGGQSSGLGGSVTIAGISSAMRSVVMPCMEGLIRQNPDVRIHFAWGEVSDLHDMLLHGKADFILAPQAIERPGYESHHLAHELNVLIEGLQSDAIRDVYLDHNDDDHFSEQFLHRHDGPSRQTVKRAFSIDIYGILEGVQRGFGRGVVPLHLIGSDTPVKLAEGYQGAWATPVILQYQVQPYYTCLHLAVRDCLIAAAPPLFQQNHPAWQLKVFY